MAAITLSQSYGDTSFSGHFKPKNSVGVVNPPFTSQGRDLFHLALEGNPAECFRILSNPLLNVQLTIEQVLSLANTYHQSLLNLMAVLNILKERHALHNTATLSLRPKTVMVAKLVSYLYNLKDTLSLLRKLYGDTQDLDIILQKEYGCWKRSDKLNFDTDADYDMVMIAVDEITQQYKKPLATLHHGINQDTKSLLTETYKQYLNDNYFFSLLKRFLPSNLARNCMTDSGLNLFKRML